MESPLILVIDDSPTIRKMVECHLSQAGYRVAIATDAESGVEMGAVGQGSRLVLRSEKDHGSIRVEWGDEPGQQCLIDYRLPERDVASAKASEGKAGGVKGYEVFDLPCRPAPPDTAAVPARARNG